MDRCGYCGGSHTNLTLCPIEQHMAIGAGMPAEPPRPVLGWFERICRWWWRWFGGGPK